MTRNSSSLAERVRKALAGVRVSERRMFGGVTFMMNGNMLCCASNTGLMVRIGREAEPTALSSPYARPCLGAGRRMPGFILVDPAGLAPDGALERWLGMARTHVATLAPKPDKDLLASRAGKPIKTTTPGRTL